jgi:hypothetical protein
LGKRSVDLSAVSKAGHWVQQRVVVKVAYWVAWTAKHWVGSKVEHWVALKAGHSGKQMVVV